jgi:hypothetical protein
MATAKELAFRLTTPIGTQFDAVFALGADRRALGEVFKACPDAQ